MNEAKMFTDLIELNNLVEETSKLLTSYTNKILNSEF